MVMSDERILAKDYGPWGNMRKKFMHEYRQGEWGLLQDAGRLDSYLKNVNDDYTANAEDLMPAELERLGVNEGLKSRDVMAWVQRYGQARANVREFLQKELEECCGGCEEGYGTGIV